MWRPGRVVAVRVRDAGGTHQRQLRADSSGRLKVALALGADVQIKGFG
jgi:hypothetical protein